MQRTKSIAGDDCSAHTAGVTAAVLTLLATAAAPTLLVNCQMAKLWWKGIWLFFEGKKKKALHHNADHPRP